MTVRDTKNLPAIEAHDVVKAYRLNQYVSLRETARRVTTRGPAQGPEVDALAGVSFVVDRGECCGLVGVNGSGKSTIMQLVAGITVPTSGHLTIRGRVLPLLAVGSGFHPDLTGRENVRLFGAILGIDAQSIEAHMDGIAEFAEVQRYLDTPVKRYSDGMQARLSFAIGMVFPADVYLFDEVLAVVDGEFRQRCIEAIGDLRRSHRTVLFVSHSMEQVAEVCDRVLWLEKGLVRRSGPPGPVLAEYQQAHASAPQHSASAAQAPAA